MIESQHTEFKRNWRDDYLKWIAGFANAEGGRLLLGIADDGNVVGLENAERLLEDIPNKVRDTLGIVVDVNLKRSHNLCFIEVVVEPYPYPVSYKGEYHYRTGSTKQELKGAALDRFLLQKQGLHWDGVPVPRLTVNQLNITTIQLFKQRAIKSQRLSEQVLDDTQDQLLDKLRLTSGDYLKRAAALLFHSDPEQFVSGAWIKIGYFEQDDADLRYQDEVHGDLFYQLEHCIELLHRKYLKALIGYKGLYRHENYPIPVVALREALLNALVHKDYTSAIPIQISVYPDKMMIWNPGSLPQSWTMAQLLAKHASKPFNPDIANVFFRAGLIESWGRGIERIQNACKSAEYAPQVQWQLETDGIWTVFYYASAYVKQINHTSMLATPEATPEATPQATPEVLAMLDVINGEMTRQEIMQAMNLKDEKHFRLHYLQRALSLGAIEMTLPDRPQSPKQKYRLTKKE